MIKARIADELGMLTGKQKLQVGVSIHFFLAVCMQEMGCGHVRSVNCYARSLEPELLHERVW